MTKHSWIPGALLLTVVCTVSAFGSLSLGITGLDLYFTESARPVEGASDLTALNDHLQWALFCWCFAVLLALISLVSAFALLKGLSDEVQRSKRGAIAPEDVAELERVLEGVEPAGEDGER